ncbi:hypothetical protein [Pseudoalteromonas piscicida]
MRKYRNSLQEDYWSYLLLLLFFVLLSVHFSKFSELEPFFSILSKVFSALLVTLTTAKIAFQNMDSNEKKKQARTDYKEFIELISSLSVRIEIIGDIILYFGKIDMNAGYFRTLPLNKIITIDSLPNKDYGALYFLIHIERKILKIRGLSEKAFSCPTYTGQDYYINKLLNLIKQRNLIYENYIYDSALGATLPNGSINVSRLVTRLGLERSRDYFMMNENIIELAIGIYNDILDQVDSLNSCADILFDKEIIEENISTIEYIPPRLSNLIDYIPLSKTEKFNLNRGLSSILNSYHSNFNTYGFNPIKLNYLIDGELIYKELIRY